MKYYDYFDIDDEINIAVRAYVDNKNIIGQYRNEISELQKENAKLDEQIKKEKDAILKRKYERQAKENLDTIKEKESKVKDVETLVKSKIDIAKIKLESKINEKNSKIETSEKNVEAVNKQLEIVKKEIEETERKADTEISPSIKEAILEGLNKKQEEYEKMLNDFISNSEKLTEERIEISKLYDNIALTNMNRFINEWNKITQKSVATPASTPTTSVSTPTTPVSTPTTPASTPTTPVSTPTTPASTPTTPVSTPTTPASTPTTPVSTPTTPASTPTTPVSTPTTPVSTPTTPASTPTTPVSTPTTPIREVKLTVGRNFKLEYVDAEHKELEFNKKVENRTLRRYVSKMDEEEKLKYIEELYNSTASTTMEKFKMDNKLKDKIDNVIDLFDDSVISGLYSLKKDNEDTLDQKEKKTVDTIIKETIVGYVYSTIANQKVKGLDITYDRSDLAKVNIPIISKRFRGEMSRKQKNYINKMSEKTSNYTNSIGTYTKNPIKRYLNDKKQKKLGAGESSRTYGTNMLEKLKDYKMAPDPDKNKTPEEIKRENERAEARRRARAENGGDGR